MRQAVRRAVQPQRLPEEVWRVLPALRRALHLGVPSRGGRCTSGKLGPALRLHRHLNDG